jgi:hypothetical protein
MVTFSGCVSRDRWRAAGSPRQYHKTARLRQAQYGRTRKARGSTMMVSRAL